MGASVSDGLSDGVSEGVSVGCDTRDRSHSDATFKPPRPRPVRPRLGGVAPGLPRRGWDDGVVDDVARPVARALPLIIAHRGSSRDLPEHTLKAYLRAIAEGADALECDVRLTADSHLVCAHDRNVERTSNGKGLVSTLELATLEGLDFGSWKLAHDGEVEMPDVDHERDKLLTLRRLIDVVMSCGREVGLVIETKHPTRYAGQVERELAQVLSEFDLDGPYVRGRPHVSVMSFSQLAVSRMRHLCPDVPLVYLMSGSVPLRFRDGSLPKGARVAGLDKEIVRRWPKTVRRQHDRGNQVYVFTVDQEADIDMCLELGVDAIISNRPAFVRDRLCVRG